MSTDWQKDVLEFHKKSGTLEVHPIPCIPTKNTTELRKSLIREEYKEVIESLEECNLEGLADGIGDLIYVLLGTAISYGMDMEPIWNLIHKANMDKFGPGSIKREDGKILKPSWWKHPNINTELCRQMDTYNV